MKRSYMLLRLEKMIDAQIESVPYEAIQYSDIEDCAMRILIGIEDLGMLPPKKWYTDIRYNYNWEPETTLEEV